MNAGTLTRRAIKAGVLPFGLPQRARHGDIVILLYHRIGKGFREIDLERSTFEGQLSYLSERSHTVTLDEALSGARGGVVVTVDDGFRDFHEHVVPLLVTYRVPVVLYLATGLVANGEHHSRSEPPPLTWSQLREAVTTGLVTVGSHTHSHADLSRATEALAEDEMRRSKELVEDMLGVPCRHFAYPWAVSGPVAERAASHLFDTAALGWGTNRRGRIDAYRLARLPVLRSDGQAFFRAKVRAMLDHEALVYRLLRRGPWRPS